MDILTLANLVAYTAQIAALVALATALAWALRIDTPSVRYAYWRTIFVLCCILPFVQGRQDPGAPVNPAAASVETSVSTATTVPTAIGSPTVDWTWLVIPLLLIGIGVRLGWLAISLTRLRRLRKAGRAAPHGDEVVELQETIGARCEIRCVDGLEQPVTFGLLRPVILVPSSLAQHTIETQRAVLSHELFHVKRRDWAWLLVEEVACAVLWFNPAIWWLVSRVHLAREVVVDELAVLATGRRRAYVQALMAFADKTSLAPVAAFGSRRHLFDRIVLLSKEAGMSSHRLVFTCAVAAAALGTGTWQAVGAFPLVTVPTQVLRQDSPGPLEQRANPVTPENPIPRRVNYEPPVYPMQARAAGAWGRVTLMITLDELGRVAEARRTSLSITATMPKVSVRFNSTNREDEKRFTINGSYEQSEAVRAIAAAIEDAAFNSVQQWRYDPPAQGPIAFPVTVTISDGERPEIPPGAGPAATGAVRADGALRVGGNIKSPVKIRDVRPVYPELARAAQVSGVVILEIRVAADGSVEEARVLRSIPLLDQAAVDAVTQWRFTPTLMNGQPTPVVMTVTVNFRPDGPEQRSPPQGEQAINVAPDRSKPVVIKDVKPSYTPEAMRARIEGTVEVQVIVGTDGSVTDARVLRGLPMLNEQALIAVRQWQFKPLPEPVVTTIEFTFHMK